MPTIQLSSLWGEWHWLQVYGKMYREQEGQWLTPVELFRPFYSDILANFVVENTLHNDTSDGIHIVELGGGRGTNANCMLTHLQQTQTVLYDRLSYTIIDASEPLIDLQKEVLSSTQHAAKVDFVFKDLLDVAEDRETLLEHANVPTVVFAMELLDNLPHDKIRRNRTSRQLEQGEIHEEGSELVEVFVPLQDTLLLDMLELVPSFGGTAIGRPSWVPSIACGVLKHISNARPSSSCAFADFDHLPPPDLSDEREKRRSAWAVGEPIVTCMNGKDHECYLTAPPFCDVLFPTDFALLEKFARKCWGDDATIETMKQSQFLERYGAVQVASTKSWLTGYSPLIHDFGNCSVLTITQQGDREKQ